MRTNGLTKKMMLVICILALVLMAGAAIYYRSLACLPFVLGVLLGAGVSILKVFLLGRTVDQAVAKQKKAATGYVYLQHLLRLALTAAALVLAALVPAFSLWGAIAGVMTYQAAVYFIRFTAKSQ